MDISTLMKVLMSVHDRGKEGFALHYDANDSTICSLLHAEYYKHKQSSLVVQIFAFFLLGKM